MGLLRVGIGTGTADKDARSRDYCALLAGITTTMSASGWEVAGGGSVPLTNVRDKLDCTVASTTIGTTTATSHLLASAGGVKTATRMALVAMILLIRFMVAGDFLFVRKRRN